MRLPLPLVASVLVVALGTAGTAVAGNLEVTQTERTSILQSIDVQAMRLNQIEAKIDALATKQKTIYDTVLYTKGYVQGGIPTIMDQLVQTCGVADEIRDYVHDNHAYPMLYDCP